MVSHLGRRLLVFAVLGGTMLAAPALARAQAKPMDPVVREGIALHDQGEFDKAIEKFDEALKRNPNDLMALYEMANSYWAKKEYKKVLELTQRGLQTARGCEAADFYLAMANAQDDGGNAEAAIDSYKNGIRECPGSSALHFNLAIAYLKKNQIDAAREELKKDVSLSPMHPSGHYYLGRVYEAQGYKVPALLAYCWFLVLEPNTARSKAASESIDRLFTKGYSKDEKTGNVTVTLDAAFGRKDEGDFGAADLVMGIAQARPDVQGRITGKPESPAKKLHSVLKLIGGLPDTGRGFASEFYVPFYAALANGPHIETFAYAVLFASGQQEARDWIAKNDKAVTEFVIWAKAFRWPSPKL